MRLIRMEFYKILHKKITLYGAVAIMLFLSLFAFSTIQGEETVVNGVKYKGLLAIKKNIEITDPYQGILTDEKIHDIIDTYGFPKKVENGYGYWRDGNYLNQFITSYFSNGYITGWNPGEYKVPTQTILIADSTLGQFGADVGKDIEFGYYKGFEYLIEYWLIGMILAGLWLIVTISPLFAEEHQQKTSGVIFTTYHGRKQHVTAKILASLAVACAAYLFIILSGILFYGGTFGFGGSNMFYIFIEGGVNYDSRIPIYQMISIFGAFLFLAMLMTVALSIWGSSREKTSYQAVVYMLLIFVLPLLPEYVFWGQLSTFFFSIMPLGHMIIDLLLDAWSAPVFLQLITGIGLIMFCIFSGWNRYRLSGVSENHTL